ncbi:hypothetical protein SKP52_02440 [Sphingopyxis fribergensis]|uniref:Uncharacterized protein n=1 Tax=Sphingopyxis fribergensis TaxID=1515612 RepID=A0A0A7PDW1_9SPHN|nr:hypothetical protein [Sphingopyxis fribergensis]AJA07423.1 hypothetical protein SKP52_02440 [Sphingopyxis fribergensis]
MTGGFSQFIRILESLQPVEARAIRVDVPLIRDATQDAWEALMAAKYGEGFETRDFSVGAVVTA